MSATSHNCAAMLDTAQRGKHWQSSVRLRLLTPPRRADSGDSMTKLLQRHTLILGSCGLLLALSGACGDSGTSAGGQTGTPAGGGTAPVAPSTTAGKPAPAAAGGSSAAAGSAAQRPVTAQPPAAGTAAPSSMAGQSAQATAGTTAPASPAVAGRSAAGAPAAAGGSAAGMSGSAGASAAASGDCDRACLLGFMQMYLDAVIAHDPKKVPLSASLKMTDNGTTAKPGDGLWKTATELVKDARLDYADPVMKNVGTQCLVNEGTSPAMYEVRLKVDGGQITEVETMTVRRDGAANSFFSPMNVKPEAVFLKMPEASEKMTRAQLESTMQLYLDYLEGKKSGQDVPFDAMCKRYENGVATASGLSDFQFQSWGFQVTRRILIIDEEAQIVWGMFPFMQSDMPLVVGEAFKMLNNKIMMIQAIMAYMPSKEWN